MITAPSRQRGMSPVAMVMMVIVVVSFGTFGVKTVPAYVDFNTIDTAIKSLLSDSKVGLLSEREVADRIGKRFMINNVDVIRVSDLEINKEGGYLTVELDYEVRNNLFSNIDIVMAFKKEYRKDIR